LEVALALFTFYPRRPDGSSTTFETIDLPDDDSALRRAHRVLQEHPSSVEVVVWRDEAPIGSVARPRP
jgi:hypothetical protein